jgi:hypothetical protein
VFSGLIGRCGVAVVLERWRLFMTFPKRWKSVNDKDLIRVVQNFAQKQGQELLFGQGGRHRLGLRWTRLGNP